MNVFASTIDLILVGARGQVGRALCRRLERQQSSLRQGAGLDLRLIGAFDRRGFAADPEGLDPSRLATRLRPRSAGDAARLLHGASSRAAPPTLVIDCTASDEIADCYLAWLDAGLGVVGANKRANSRCLASYRKLQRTSREKSAPYRYESTVGAAIPLLGPLRDLRLRGERIHSLQGVLSGSLSYVFFRMHEGTAFSEAVGEARELGYTEPDPLEDLRATDLLRKLLVIGREAGFETEPADVRIEALLDPCPAHGAPLVEALRAADEPWRLRIDAAIARGERLVVIAEASATTASIGVHSVATGSQFANLRPGQNLILVRTELQDETPLALGGPGAGAEVTAAGVLSDVIGAAAQLAAREASAVSQQGP